jgi:hypothetical protein
VGWCWVALLTGWGCREWSGEEGLEMDAAVHQVEMVVLDGPRWTVCLSY